ncbi:hypothetical protein FHR84_004170 [Actinopolyspora biskrensis]|uniref:Anti-sigma-M factor RsmA n=1 Tax=Actinopolyspora biskrensis TaxID=1470178 RepID=A0A852Z465_9ACTN|nr:hypothetical protein [Actinopolyspora biskrensis]NYH80802.1 hypothetical protein [Actinopolyspora biskrensis]
MSGEELSAGTPRDPDWSPDVLADLHAGALDEETAGRIDPAARTDPEAVAILTALEDTRTELAGQPAFEIPEEVAARIENSLAAEPLPPPAADTGRAGRADPAAESARENSGPEPAEPEHPPPDNVTPIGRASGSGSRRRRAFALGSGLVAAAAAMLAVVLIIQPNQSTREDPRADDTAAAPQPGGEEPSPLALTGDRVELEGQRLQEVLSSEQYVDSLVDPQRLLACLRANGIEDGSPLGSREISFNGQRAQLMVLSTGEIGRFRLLAVGPGCGAGNPATLSDTVVGG